MKAIVILAFASMAAAASIDKGNLKELVKDVITDVVEDVIEYYTTLNDNLDIEALINDDKELQSHVNCYKDVGPCTDLTNSYKAVIPDAIKTACKKCNTAQKHLAKRFFEGLKEKKPEEYQNLRKMWDPENKYFDAYEKAVANY